ncbi:MAG: SRPBCC family protein [Saprospiraceae bacterium]|nr:SRPBCC family protein [Saprospiraceae bacterium]
MRKIVVADLEKAHAGAGQTPITVEATVNASVQKVWDAWTGSEHIVKWNQASDDWHCPQAKNDLQPGGRFTFTMAAKDGSFSFDFSGTYDSVDRHRTIAYTMDDGRKAQVLFEEKGGKTHICETFDAENMHAEEMQRAGWQAILDNFKKYVEG